VATLGRMSVLSRASSPTPAQLTALLDSAGEALVMIDARRRIAWCNRAATRRLGCEIGQPLDPLRMRLAHASRAAFDATLAAAAASPSSLQVSLTDGTTWRLVCSPGPGGLRCLAGSAVAGANPAEPPEAGRIAGGPDRSRLDPHATSEVVRLLWDAPQALWVLDPQGRVVAANRALLQALQLPQSQVLGRPVLDFVPPEEREALATLRQGVSSGAEGVEAAWPPEQRLCGAEGQERWFRVMPRRVSADDGTPLEMAILIDLTPERQARAQIDRSLDEMAQWFDLSPVGMLVVDETGLVLRSNAAFEALVGRAPVMLGEAAPDLLQLLAWEGGRPHPQLQIDGPAIEVLATLRTPDGRAPRLRARLRAFRSSAGSMRVMAVVEDRSLEDERDLAHLEIGALMDTAGVGLATYEASRGWLPSRAPAGKGGGGGLMAGLQSIRRDQVEPGSLPDFERLQHALRHGERAQVRYEVQVPDLGRRWLLTRVEPGELTGGRAAMSVVTLDITEQEESRRRAREALQAQAERTRAILDSVLVGIITVDERGIEWMNRSARRMFGGQLADFVAQPIWVVATDEPDHPLRATHYLHGLAEGQAETFECRLRARDGREFWVVGNAVLTGTGSPGRQVTFALLDIERRRQAEVSIARARTSLQRIIETAPLAIALFDAGTGRLVQHNTMAAQFFGQATRQLVGCTPEECLGAEEAAALRLDFQEVAQGTEVRLREVRRPEAPASPLKEGAESAGAKPAALRTWDLRIVSIGGHAHGALGSAAASDAADPAAAPVAPAQGRERPMPEAADARRVGGASWVAPEGAQWLLVASDVTEQRAAEQARFDAAVSQREMLVKEVHHRIKNNLQGVAGLLQQTAARRPEVASLISEVVGQVQAIAQVHGLQVGISGPLRCRALIEAITASVQRTFGRPIECRVKGEAVHRFALPEAESIPIALTVNELLTNAVKHSDPGPITCTLECGAQSVAVRIEHAGQLREGFSLAQVPPGVSGLGLVRALLPRRSATLTLTECMGQVCAELRLAPPSFTLLDPL